MKKNISNYFVPIMVIVILITPLFLFAQGAGLEGEPGGTNTKETSGGTYTQPVKIDIKIDNPFKQDTIKGLIETIVNDILIPIGAVIAVMMIMYAGFMYVTAGGDPAKIKKAHDALLWAVIGAAILLGAWVIEKAISATIDQLKAP